jgi:hypothetical protein
MFILDSLLVGGLRFVFDKIATVVDTEMNDPSALRERLMTAELQLELGEIDQDTFEAIQADVLARLREMRERQEGDEPATDSPQDYKITGIEASFEGDEH